MTSPTDNPAADSPLSGNIIYRSDEIARHYAENRVRWADFYPSERWVFDTVAARRGGGFGAVLDVGCAAGGLGAALAERGAVDRYVGVDINAQAVAVAATRSYPMPTRFHACDILDPAVPGDAVFDTVFSLSAADWNVDTRPIIAECWRRVKPGGRLIISLRLTPEAGAEDMARSYQYVSFGPIVPDNAERAAYVVFNIGDALALLGGLSPAEILGYGYWGAPSSTARTPFEKLVFTVFALRKPEEGEAPPDDPRCELLLPTSALIAAAVSSSRPSGS